MVTIPSHGWLITLFELHSYCFDLTICGRCIPSFVGPAYKKSNVVGGHFPAGADWENRPLALDGGLFDSTCSFYSKVWLGQKNKGLKVPSISKCSDRRWMLSGRIGLMYHSWVDISKIDHKWKSFHQSFCVLNFPTCCLVKVPRFSVSYSLPWSILQGPSNPNPVVPLFLRNSSLSEFPSFAS